MRLLNPHVKFTPISLSLSPLQKSMADANYHPNISEMSHPTATLIAAFVASLSALSLSEVVSLLSTAVILVAFSLSLRRRRRDIYLVDFACYKNADPSLTLPMEKFMAGSKKVGTFTPETLAFQRKLIERSGLGQETSMPPSIAADAPPSMEEARKEAEMVMFGAVDELLKKTGARARDIGIVVVNCSLFNPTPSLSSMVVNRYKLRENVLSYNLGGMGCSAGLISIELASQLLKVNPNSYALVVSMENLTRSWYLGNNRSMLVQNCIFRMGGAAVLLTNRSSDRSRSKYLLLHTVRTHKGADDKSYASVFQHEDDTGRVGVELSKDIATVAGAGLKTNITALAPLVLPMSEKLLYTATLVARNILRMRDIKPFVPDLKKALDHFCVHAGGRAVLDVVEKNLGLSEKHMEASRMTLYRFGNTSSSSPWYELAYEEAKGEMKKGDRTWQIAFGAGFKCNSVVWLALRTIDPSREKNVWTEEIHGFPVSVPKVATFETS